MSTSAIMDVSLFDQTSTKDSGFSEDSLESISEKLLDDEPTICFVEAFEDTPTKTGNRKRLFCSPIVESPSLVVANSLKRLKLTPKNNRIDQDVQRGVIKDAVEKSSEEGNLVGDFSKEYALPLIEVTQSELKMISGETMKDLLDGKYKDLIQSFQIIDSRYPYEYEGGHIRGAINIYTQESCLKLLDNSPHPKDTRHILIFHCEFSQERGPSMNRTLRKEDRTRNAMNYPKLNYPEMYVLEGGYKKFFQEFSEYCEPNTYRPMLHPENLDDLKFFRRKSKIETMGTSKKCFKGAGNSKVVRRTLSDDFC
ncbi:unnamed protein product [Ceutorhynchus assimilis]|uniref:protein-tyrosine-phosphatase n=1 Tax=Ceutorhynchus assimilis TaxID=467358 RepID=A0A9N9QBR2_9CUCU|nr:unnamed protein product [Ceutorhynchus assimilis]